MDGKTCEVVFDQDNGIPFIIKYIDYMDEEEKVDVELYDPMTGVIVHKKKLLMKELDKGDDWDCHSNYRFAVIIKKGESMHMCMPRLKAIRRFDNKDTPVFVTWQIVKSEDEKINENS